MLTIKDVNRVIEEIKKNCRRIYPEERIKHTIKKYLSVTEELNLIYIT